MKTESSADQGSPGPKVLWVTPNIRGAAGGPTSTVVNGLIAEREGGTESELATTSVPHKAGEGSALARLEAAGVKVHHFHRAGPKAPAAAWGLSPGLTFWLVRNLRRYDVLHLQYVWCWTTVLGCALARLFRIPVILTPHVSLTGHDIEVASRSMPKQIMKRVLRRFVLGSVDALLLMSELEERDTENEGVPVHLVPHAIPLPTANPRPDSVEKLDVADGGTRIGFLGRIAPAKGVDRLIRAISLSAELSWKLEVAGPPPGPSLAGEYRDMIAELGLVERVRWLGFVDQQRDAFLASLDVLVMPSEYEGFGMVAAEAMLNGTPVIVPRQAGIAPLVEDSGGGIVIERSDPERIHEALISLAGDPGRRERAGAKAKAAVERTHSPAAFNDRTSRIYEAVIEAREPPSRPDR